MSSADGPHPAESEDEGDERERPPPMDEIAADIATWRARRNTDPLMLLDLK